MKIKRIILLFIIVWLLFFTQSAYAANYTYNLGTYLDGSNGAGSTWNTELSSINIEGINKTQGTSQNLGGTLSSTYLDGSRRNFYYNYTLPNDGSAWDISGSVTLSTTGSFYNSETGNTSTNTTFICVNIYDTKTTPGTFTGYSPKTATDAANAANTAAGQAATAANNAKTAADSAKTSADTAAANAQSALNAVSNANGSTVTAVRDASGTVLDASRSAVQKIDTLQATVNNYLAADTSPPIIKLSTVSGALATSGSHIRAVVNASDNVSTAFWYSLDGIVYQPLPADGGISLPVYFSGNNLITVWVKDEAGNVGRDSITIRKLGM